jgi:hypothetical protein
MTRLNSNLPSLSLKPLTSQNPVATLRQPASASRPELRTSPSVRQAISDASQFQPAQALRRPVALNVAQPQASAPQGTPSVRVPGGFLPERPVGIVPEDRSVQVGDELRTTTTAERLEQASQDPLFRLRLAILKQRLDIGEQPQGPIIDRRPGSIIDQRPDSTSVEPPVGIVPEPPSVEARNELRTTTTAERLEQASQDPLFRLRLAILKERLGF